MKKLFLLALAVMLLCTWAMADNSDTVDPTISKTRITISNEAAAVGLCDNAFYDNGAYDSITAKECVRRTDGSREAWIVDDVELSVETHIGDIHWTGINDGTFDYQGTADLIILADAGGSPGAPVVELFDLPNSRVDTGEMFGGGIVYMYNLYVDITLPAGIYWFGMRPVNQGPSGTNYCLSAPVIGSNCYFRSEDLGVPDWTNSMDAWGIDTGVAFCLTDDPTPSGACCDQASSLCDDNVSILDCPTGYRFEDNTLCADLDPVCGPLPDFTLNAPGSASGSTCGAGNDCGLGANSEEHIYEVVIPNAGNWVFTLCNGTDYDSYIFLGTTYCGQEIGSNDDFCDVQSQITATLDAGTYYLDIEGYLFDCGNYVLDVYDLTGSCCVDLACVGTMPQAECSALGGLWAVGQDCATYQCPVGCIDQQTYPPSAVNAFFADYDYPQWIADNFNLGSATDIYGFEFWGGYYTEDIPMEPDVFTVYIREDSAGVPGAALYSFPNIPASYREQTGAMLFDVHEWRYEVSLGPINLPAGNYWFEVNNDSATGQSGVWLWETGVLDPINGVLGHAFGTTSDAGPWNPSVGSDMSFRLACEPFDTFGACCHDETGECTDDVSNSDCPSRFRFVANTFCADLVPACGTGPGVPGEASHYDVPADQMHASLNGTTGQVDVTYTPACDAADHTIYYGDLSGVSTYGYSGAACFLGSTGAASFDPGTGNSFFLIVANDGAEEGSYGHWEHSGTDGERDEAVGLPACDYMRNLGGVVCE